MDQLQFIDEQILLGFSDVSPHEYWPSSCQASLVMIRGESICRSMRKSVRVVQRLLSYSKRTERSEALQEFFPLRNFKGPRLNSLLCIPIALEILGCSFAVPYAFVLKQAI